MRCLLLTLLLLSTSVMAEHHVTELDGEAFKGGLYQAGNLFLAGQPLEASAISQVKQLGVTTIVNLRTSSEIEEWAPIEEEKLAAAQGLAYIHLPAGDDDHPYSPAQVDTLAEILASANGPVLLHCRSGHRATHLWVAYLAAKQGLTLDEAVALGRQVNFGSSAMEKFLGDRVSYQYKAQ